MGAHLNSILNPPYQARPCKSLVWRRKSSGLNQLRSTERKKAGSGGKVATFTVAIVYRHDEVLCEQYDEKLTRPYFASFIRWHFADEVFTFSKNSESQLFLQDGDPRQKPDIAKKLLITFGLNHYLPQHPRAST